MLRRSCSSSSSFECLSQKKSCAVQLRLTSARGDAHHLRYFLVLVAFHVVEHEHPPRSWRQFRNRLLQVHPFNVERRSRHLVPAIVFHITLLGSRVQLALGLPCIQHHIHCHPFLLAPNVAF